MNTTEILAAGVCMAQAEHFAAQESGSLSERYFTFHSLWHWERALAAHLEVARDFEDMIGGSVW